MKSIIICAVATFLLLLSIYALVFHRNPLNRIGFALFLSLLPAVLALIIARLYRFSSRGAVVTYVILLLMMIAIQGWLR
jgi:hypothetical protein